MGYEKAVVRNLSRIEARKLGLALLVGCCIVIMTYFISMSETVDQQLSVAFKIKTDEVLEGKTNRQQPGRGSNAEEKRQSDTKIANVTHFSSEDKVESKKPEDEKTLPPPRKEDAIIQMAATTASSQSGAEPICDFSNFRTEFCAMKGDVRVHNNPASVIYISPHHQPNQWQVVPYVRKHMGNVDKVTVSVVPSPQGMPKCTVNQSVPAVVFALGGFTGNYYHDFTDVLLPLFLTMREFDGEVQFLVTNIQPWWLSKYQPIMKRLTRYEFVDLDRSAGQVFCHPHVMVDLRFHNDLIVDPARAPNGYSMRDFTRFLRESYSLKRDRAVSLREHPEARPRLLLVERNGTRRFRNVGEIVATAEGLGFEVVRADANFGDVAGFVTVVNSCDVIMGVHGAGLTNFVFLPENSVVIQVVPCCELERMATHTFGTPAMGAGLHYLEYNINVDESTLLEFYPREDPVFTDPQSVHRQGWFKMGKIYLRRQDVRLDVNRFRPFLLKALDFLRQ